MPEGALLTKITNEVTFLTNLLISSPILTRTLGTRYTLPSQPPPKPAGPTLWLTDFLNDWPYPLRTHCQSLMESKFGEINSMSLEKVDKFLWQKLNSSPKEFMLQTKELISQCLSLTLLTSTVNEFILEDLSKVERLFDQLTENVGKFYSNKSKKIQANLETLEKLLKRATFAPIPQKKKKAEIVGQNSETQKPKTKNSNPKKHAAGSPPKPIELEGKLVGPGPKNSEVLKEKEIFSEKNINHHNNVKKMIKLSGSTVVASGNTKKDSSIKTKKKNLAVAENFIARGSDNGCGLPTILEYEKGQKTKGHGKNDGSRDL